MKKEKKKILMRLRTPILVVGIPMLIIGTFMLACYIWFSVSLNNSLKNLPKYEDREVGDYVVRFYVDDCRIIGTTEQGNNQRFLVIPDYIDGVRVVSLGFLHFVSVFLPIDAYVVEIENDVVEKVYFETEMELSENAFHNCPNVLKIMYPKVDSESYSLANEQTTVYYPRKAFEKEYDTTLIYREHCSRANVSYYYNYENGENDGYYWIDDCDYGGKIEFIPKDPTREDYTFAGWYKEPECINKWEFDKDTLPKEIKEEQEIYKNGEYVLTEVPVYQETILYAKWI